MLNIKKLNRALVFVKNKDFTSAEKIYYELLRENPNDETVLSFWGLFNIKRGMFSKAEKILESAYKIKKSPSTIASLALTKFNLKKYDDAIILYEELFRYDKESEKIYQKIIECFRRLKMYNFAGAYCQKFLASHPDNRAALSLMTQNYMDIGDYKKAEEYCAKTLELYPENPSSWVTAGLLQELLYCNEEIAQECYKKAIENRDSQGYYYLAVSLQKIGKLEEAEYYYKKTLELFPDDEDAKASLGCLYLSQKNMKKGFEYFLQVKPPEEFKTLKNFNSREEGGTLLVYADQGLGDCIMNSRYLPELKNKFSKIIVNMRTPLISIMQRSFPHIEFINEGMFDVEHDSSMFLAYAPYFLNMDFNNIPSSQGYLLADETKVNEYKEKYFKTNKLKVGLCWKAGDMAMRAAINRTINIDYFKPLLELKNVEFYSFQKDDIFNAIEKYPQLVDLSSTFESFDDTAAALKNLDLLISVDTSTLHLAGALGVKSKLLIPYCSDWRWFDNTEKTEWYDSVDVIKQEERQDWYKEVDILTDYVKNF